MPPDLRALLSASALQDLVALAMTGERLFAVDAQRLGMARPERSAPDAPKSIAIVPFQGAMVPKGSGGFEGFRARMLSAGGNGDVGAIVIDAHSPGGTVAGTPETAEVVRQVAASKPVIALVDTLAASACYYAISQASQIWMTPSAEVGSIGVRGMHFDVSQMLADNGVKVTDIVSTDSPYKAELSPFAPLSQEAQDYVRTQADREMGRFVEAVATGRKTTAERVKSDFGKGRTVGAEQALQLGMADRIGTMGDVLASLRTKAGAVRRRSSLAFA